MADSPTRKSIYELREEVADLYGFKLHALLQMSYDDLLNMAKIKREPALLAPPPNNIYYKSIKKILGDSVYEPFIEHPFEEKIAPYTYNKQVIIDNLWFSLENITIHEDVFFFEWMLNKVTPQEILQAIKKKGLIHLKARIDVFYNLLWYIHLYPILDDLSLDEMAYISFISDKVRLDLLGPKYNGPTDTASLIFAILTRKSTHKYNVDPVRYNQVIRYSNIGVSYLAFREYNIINRIDDELVVSVYPPHVHISMNVPVSNEIIVGGTQMKDIGFLIDKYGMTMPLGCPDIPDEDKYAYLFEHFIKLYGSVFGRPENTPPIPELRGMKDDDMRDILNKYTNTELFEFSEMINCGGHTKTINHIINQYKNTTPTWSLKHKFCVNDDTENIIMAEKHGDMNKDDYRDPTLSYGTIRNYRCYQKEELAQSFREIDGIFKFLVPDWLPNQNDVPREFSLESVKDLRKVLTSAPPAYDLDNLISKIDEGIRHSEQISIVTRELVIEYSKLSTTEKDYVRLFIMWMFCASMWARMWKGPKYELPLRWIEYGGNRSTSAVRDAHMLIQYNIVNSLLDRIGKTPARDWIDKLPIVLYDYTTDTGRVSVNGAHTIMTIINKMEVGNFCLSHGSELLLDTSYFVMKHVFKYKIDQINPMLANVWKELVEWEVLSLNNMKNDPQFKDIFQVIEERLADAAIPSPLPLFQTEQITKTAHTDPQLGQELRFETKINTTF